MKKVFLVKAGLGIVIVALSALIFSGIIDLVNEIDEEKAAYEEVIGKKINIDGEMYTVMNHKMLEEVFVLSNGAEIDEDYALKVLGRVH